MSCEKVNRNRIKLPSGLEIVRKHVCAIRWETAEKGVWVYMHASGTFPIVTADIAPFIAWWDASKAKRVKADATPEPPAEPKPGPWVVSTGGAAGCVPSVNNKQTGACILVGGLRQADGVANALAYRVAKLLNESEVTA